MKSMNKGDMIYTDDEQSMSFSLAIEVSELENELLKVKAERNEYMKILNDIRPCSVCQKYAPNWTKECLECAKYSKVYRPFFVLREVRYSDDK